MTAKLLEINNLATRFHTDSGIVNAVNGVSYTLGESETLGVVGESGCGKSVHALSLMRLIPIPPGEIYQGEVLYNGRDILKVPDNDMRKIRGGEIAMIFQDPMTSLNPVMKIGKQITEALHLHTGMDDYEARERAGEMLDLVGIPDATSKLDSFPHEFSGGMRQRAMIAMALSCNPGILIADEPTTALDVTIQAQIIELIRRLRDKLGMAIIWITHDLGIMAGLAEKLNVMYAGYIVEKAPVKQLYGDPRHPYTLGLLKSLPRVDQSKKDDRLIPIDGRPPDLLGLPKGCPFESRCAFAIDRCKQENPGLTAVDTDHEIACWVDVKTGKPREVVA